jgi:sulfate adenylyltransferase large subunit
MSYADRLDTDILTFLDRHEKKHLLRFVTVGSVDDGKSTLIGRLLHDTDGVYEDQLEDARKGSGDDVEIDFALITDGLAAEREQGITIDVAYRYFTTQHRKFIIADTPGHVQYTRNMATGASTADVAVILIDARLGVLQQSRRHAYIASLLGIPHLFVCVNKMDVVDFDQARFEEIKADFKAFAKGLQFTDVTYLPVSALKGDNVVKLSENTPWYEGVTFLENLETVEVGTALNLDDFRFPVQTVIRPNQNYRGYAGQLASGVVEVGDEITVLPSGKTSRVESIDTFDGLLDEAFAPMSVTLCLEDEIDISRGDMIVHSANVPHLSRTFDATVVWMSEKPLDTGKSYLLKHTSRYVRAGLHGVHWKLNMDTLAEEETDTLELNEIGRVTVTAHQPLVFDAYHENRGAGCFVIVDSLTNNTVGAGMILEPEDLDPNQEVHTCSGLSSGVSDTERADRLRQHGCTLLVRGQVGDALTHLAYGLERRLFDLGYFVHVLDPADHHAVAHGSDNAAIFEAAKVCTSASLVTVCLLPELSDEEVANARKVLGDAQLMLVDCAGGEGDFSLDLGASEEDKAIKILVSHLKDQGVLLTD